MFKGFFIACIVQFCPEPFDPIFAVSGSILEQFDPQIDYKMWGWKVKIQRY